MGLYVSNIYLTIRAKSFWIKSLSAPQGIGLLIRINIKCHTFVRWLVRAIEHFTSKSFLETFLALCLLDVVQFQDQTSSKLTNKYRYIELWYQIRMKR